MSVPVVYALHGFLGTSADWQTLLKSLSTSVQLIAENMFAPGFRGLTLPKATDTKKIFIGYSLGGRLGLKIMSQNSEAFDHYIFVSVNPGLHENATEERAARQANDQKWSDKISIENWNAFLKEWNAQDVFKNSIAEPERPLGQFDVELLKKSLRQDSLAQQPDFRSLIKQNKNRITWVVGSDDAKFKKIAHDMQELGILGEVDELKCGHRVLIDNPQALAQVVDRVLKQLPTSF